MIMWVWVWHNFKADALLKCNGAQSSRINNTTHRLKIFITRSRSIDYKLYFWQRHLFQFSCTFSAGVSALTEITTDFCFISVHHITEYVIAKQKGKKALHAEFEIIMYIYVVASGDLSKTDIFGHKCSCMSCSLDPCSGNLLITQWKPEGNVLCLLGVCVSYGALLSCLK